MKYILIFILSLVTTTAVAQSATPSCVSIKPVPPRDGYMPKNFTIVTPCQDAEEPASHSDYFWFVGDATIIGKIHYSKTVTFGPHAMFIVDDKSKSQLPFHINTFRFYGPGIQKSAAVAVAAFKLPELAGKGKNCWVAPASIRIKQIERDNNDFDSSGNYLREFTVLDVGKFIACKAETER